MAQVKTVTTSAGENTITFDAFFPYIWIRNSGEGDITAANYSGASAGDIDTVSIKAGEIAMIQAATASVYIIGATTAELHAQGFAECPFKRSGKGGEQITVTPLSVSVNGTYTAEQGTAYSPVTVDVQEQPWAPLQDGYSNFWFELTNDTLSPWLNFSAKNADAVIDWGDGSGEVALDTLTPTHTYSKAGRYVVKCKGVTGIGVQHSVPFTKYCRCLSAIELNNEVTDIRPSAFFMTVNLKNASAKYVTSIGSSAFAYCSALSYMILPNNLATTDSSTFQFDFSLLGVELPSNLENIASSIFYYCRLLQTITIPASVTSIGNTAFGYCSSLLEIHCLGTVPPTLGTSSFGNLPTNWIAYVPVGYGDAYKAAWPNYYEHILEEGETVTRAMQRKFAKEAEKQLDEIETEEKR